MKIVCFSDTHGRHPYIQLPDGDVLVFAGDYTAMHSAAEFENFIRWMAEQPHRFKVFMPGNHDWFIQWNLPDVRNKMQQFGIMCPSSRLHKVGGLRVYGMPLVPQYGDWAFMVPDRSPKMEKACQRIPEGLDILVTHGPANGILDQTYRGPRAGSLSLRDAISRAKPKLHICGHIHEARGQIKIDDTIHVNASISDIRYHPTNTPIVVDL